MFHVHSPHHAAILVGPIEHCAVEVRSQEIHEITQQPVAILPGSWDLGEVQLGSPVQYTCSTGST